jgi:urease accessory protein
MDNDSYLLLLLSDGNLPTGSFVSSSGLESYLKHGFPLDSPSTAASSSSPRAPANIQTNIDFIRQSLAAYARIALPFTTEAHSITASTPQLAESQALSRLQSLDMQYESMTLNHITRRSSKAQGVALLSLFSKGFARPLWLDAVQSEHGPLPAETASREELIAASYYEALVDAYKLSIRKGDSPGHLPICWGVLTAAISLSQGMVQQPDLLYLSHLSLIDRSQQLFLFLYSRSLLSASIRLNAIGPYAAQQLLLHVIRDMVNEEAAKSAHLRVPSTSTSHSASQEGEDWERWERDDIPATTWPLGEILAGRHDLQHSRIFNS